MEIGYPVSHTSSSTREPSCSRSTASVPQALLVVVATPPAISRAGRGVRCNSSRPRPRQFRRRPALAATSPRRSEDKRAHHARLVKDIRSPASPPSCCLSAVSHGCYGVRRAAARRPARRAMDRGCDDALPACSSIRVSPDHKTVAVPKQWPSSHMKPDSMMLCTSNTPTCFPSPLVFPRGTARH